MRVLAIDTSSSFLHISLVDGGKVVADLRFKGTVHGKLLHPSVSFIQEYTGFDLEDLDLVSLGVGPGSFTGIRVGLSFGIGLSMGLGVPAVGVSSLKAKAFSVPFDGTVVSLVDGRRGEVFYGVYRVFRGSIEEVAPESRVKVKDLSKVIPEGSIVLADGKDSFLDGLKGIVDGFITVEDVGSVGLSLAVLGKRKFKESGSELPFIKAIYLRRSDPEEAKGS